MGTQRVSASVTSEDVRRSFFDDFAQDERYWWWPATLYLDPKLVIADDDEGALWACPYSTKGDSVTWGEPAEVAVQYVEVGSGKVAAARAKAAGVSATAAEARPKDRVRAATATEKEEETMGTIPSAILERLELPEDATEEQALAKLAELKTEQPPPGDGGDGDGDEEGAGTPQAVAAASVDPAALQQLQEDARLGREAREQQLRAERAQLVDAKIKDGYIPSASRAAHLRELEQGGEIEKMHRAYLEGLTAVLVPVEERGTTGGDQHTGIESQVAAGLAAAGVKSRKES